MISPLRFIRRLMALPGNIERLSERAMRGSEELTTALHQVHGELRAIRLERREQIEEEIERLQAMIPALESMAQALGRHDQLFDQSVKSLNTLSQKLPDTQAKILSLLQQLNDNENSMQRAELLQNILHELKVLGQFHASGALQKIEDYLCNIRNSTALLDGVHPMKQLVSDVKNNTDDLRKGAFLMAADKRMEEILLQDPRRENPLWLNRYEHQVYSQNGEDGIIAEIFKRIGTTGKMFVECGVSDGLECNTAALLLGGWNGVWVEKDEIFVSSIRSHFAQPLQSGLLSLVPQFLTAENAEETFRTAGIPEEFDLLSIDIDGNDYWIWKALDRFKPRAVVIEYNAVMKPPLSWVMKYDPHYTWNGTRHYGASLSALEKLGTQKGYKLVCCEITGNNAFFVRADLAEDKFLLPSDAETHYQPPRYYLVHTTGHKRDFGGYDSTE